TCVPHCWVLSPDLLDRQSWAYEKLSPGAGLQLLGHVASRTKLLLANQSTTQKCHLPSRQSSWQELGPNNGSSPHSPPASHFSTYELHQGQGPSASFVMLCWVLPGHSGARRSVGPLSSLPASSHSAALQLRGRQRADRLGRDVWLGPAAGPAEQGADQRVMFRDGPLFFEKSNTSWHCDYFWSRQAGRCVAKHLGKVDLLGSMEPARAQATMSLPGETCGSGALQAAR
ncbi:GPS domain-containing protein, partial [Podarcis lilfordi]